MTLQLGLQFSKALGADTYALSHSDSKLHDAEGLGVKPENFIITKDVKACAKQWERKFDLLICTAFNSDMPIDSLYLRLLKPESTLVLCGLPENGLPNMYAQAFVGKGVGIAGSLIAPPSEIEEMLELAAEKGIKAWTELRPMSEAAQAIKDMDAGKARYRYVLDAKK